MKHALINSYGGYLKICSVFDFVRDVRVEYCPEFNEQIAVMAHKFHDRRRYVSDANAFTEVEMAKSIHKLTMNPMKLLTELKKTTTKKQFTKHLTLEELVCEMSRRSVEWLGRPTHLFSIGENTYCMVAEEDCRLFMRPDMTQQLVCLRPERNFHIIAKNVKVDI